MDLLASPPESALESQKVGQDGEPSGSSSSAKKKTSAKKKAKSGSKDDEYNGDGEDYDEVSHSPRSNPLQLVPRWTCLCSCLRCFPVISLRLPVNERRHPPQRDLLPSLHLRSPSRLLVGRLQQLQRNRSFPSHPRRQPTRLGRRASRASDLCCCRFSDLTRFAPEPLRPSSRSSSGSGRRGRPRTAGRSTSESRTK